MNENIANVPSPMRTLSLDDWFKYACDLEKIDSTRKGNENLDKLEAKLRLEVEKHREFLLDVAEDEEVSRRKFVSQLVERVAECDALTEYNSDRQPFVKLVSIDVDCRSIHSLLLKMLGTKELESFFSTILGDRNAEEFFASDSALSNTRLVSETHVTLAHFRQDPQEEMRSLFNPLRGKRIRLAATSLLWNDRIAALGVNVEKATECGTPVPVARNKFVHITLWFTKEASAVESNDLPKLVAAGDAGSFEFETPLPLDGTISLWQT